MKRFFLLFLGLMVLNVFAQIPENFKYQTVVRDAAGAVLQYQNVSFQISILQGSATGTPVYTETHSATTNEFGLVNLTIGQGTTSDDFSAIDWSSGPYYLKVELDETGGTAFQEMGTSQLLTVPYAMYAKDVANKDDADADPNNEIQTISKSGNTITLSNGGGSIIDDVDDADSDPTNEIQTLTKSGNTITLSNGGGSVTDEVNDADSDPSNEIQIINFSNDTLYLDNGGQVYLGNYSNLWQQIDTNIYYNNGWVGVGTDSPTGKMVVQGDEGVDPDSALFEVKNKNGQTIFAVYDGGVRIWVDDTGTKANTDKKGFAVGGYRIEKTISNEYLRVTPDSIRMYFDNQSTAGQGHTGGFAIQSFDGITKSGNTGILYLEEDNYFIGENSGTLINTGKYNSTMGFQAGMALTEAYRNVFMGYNAGKNTNIGDDNVFIGNEAGVGNTKGFNNVVLGSYAGTGLDSASNNVIIGKQAGENLVDGMANIFIGTQAGWGTDSAVGNVFIGDNAGMTNTFGNNNIFLGAGSGYGNTTGSDNVFLGTGAGETNTTGFCNIFIGKNSGLSSDTSKYNTFLGFQSGLNNKGDGNVFLGEESGFSNIEGNFNIYIGKFAGHNLTGGDNNIFLGFEAGMNSNYSNSLVINSSHTVQVPLIYGKFENDRQVVIDGDDFDNFANRKFFVNGEAGGLTAWFNDSDRKLKEDIVTIHDALDKVLKLRGVNYYWKDKEKYPSSLQMGFIAQEAQQVIPEVVEVHNNHYSMQYAPITALLVEAIKEQQKIIEQLKIENKKLTEKTSEIDELKAEVEQLKEILEIKAEK